MSLRKPLAEVLEVTAAVQHLLEDRANRYRNMTNARKRSPLYVYNYIRDRIRAK